MRTLLLSSALLIGLPVGAVRPADSHLPATSSAANTALAELQRAVGAVATVTAAPANGGQPQEAAFGRPAGAAIETKAGVRVPLTSGRAVQLKNLQSTEDETSAIAYQYRGAEPKTGLIWVKKVPYECPTHLLVSRTSGQATDIGNEPRLNAAGTLLFARQNDCFMVFEDYYPGCQLWRVQNGQLKLLKQVRLKNYFVVEGRWLAPSKLRLELGRIEGYDGRLAKVRRLPFELLVKE